MALLARRTGPRRRMLADINVVPYVDVMLVLVVILMVSAPFVNPSLVNLPSVGKSSKMQDKPLELSIKADGSIVLREIGSDKDLARNLPDAVRVVKKRQSSQPEASKKTPVVIAADKDLKYDQVMKVMSALQKGDIARVGLAVKQE